MLKKEVQIEVINRMINQLKVRMEILELIKKTVIEKGCI